MMHSNYEADPDPGSATIHRLCDSHSERARTHSQERRDGDEDESDPHRNLIRRDGGLPDLSSKGLDEVHVGTDVSDDLCSSFASDHFGKLVLKGHRNKTRHVSVDLGNWCESRDLP